jgi:hypothetical protein
MHLVDRALPVALLLAIVACSGGEMGTPKLRKADPAAQDTGEDEEEGSSSSSSPPPGATKTAPASPPPVETPLSELDVEVIANGYGPLEKDMSIGEIGANDGKPISVGGVVFPKGLGVHADSELRLALGGQYKTFAADVGVDDEVPEGAGSVVFQVFADDVMLFDSGIMTRATGKKAVSVDVSGKQQLKLVVTNAADNHDWDHADWAGARLVK